MSAGARALDLGGVLVVDRGSAVTLEAQISRQVAYLIASGDLGVGDRLPPIRGLAATLGVNLHTVRAAYERLAEGGLVEMTRGRGTTVVGRSLAGLARDGRATRTFTVGVILPSFDPFYAPVVEGIHAAAEGDPSSIVVGFADERADSAESHLRRFLASGIDGVVVVSQKFGALDLDADGLPPIVYADWPGSPAPSIVFDPAPMGDLIDHLHGHGLGSFALVSPPTHHPNLRPLVGAFEAATARLGVDAAITQVGGWGPEDGVAAVERLLEESADPVAIVCATDQLAAGGIRAAIDRGRVFGRDVAVTGWGGIAYTTLLEPALTTVRLPAREVGHRAVSMVLDMAAGRPVPAQTTLVGSLVLGRSCGDHPGGTDGAQRQAASSSA